MKFPECIRALPITESASSKKGQHFRIERGVTTRLTRVKILAILGGTGMFAGACAQLCFAQNASGRTADQAYKNIQVLKGVPAEQLIPAMQFITASLGVECDFCHVAGEFEKDDKKPKQTARKMMLMMFAINRDNFDGKRKVTCYSCHRGGEKPLDAPIISEGETRLQAALAEKASPAQLSVEPIVERYVEAVGGKSAIQGISSRVAEGKAEIAGREFPVEIFYQALDKVSTVIHLPAGDNISVYDGREGWILFPGQPVREMEQYEFDGARIDADINLPLELQDLSSNLRLGSAKQTGVHETYMVSGSWQGKQMEFSFDKESGLLVRLVRYVESPLGRNPVQTDYSDYRQSGAVKIPFRWKVARPGARFTIQLERVRQNIPVDHRRFEKPTDTQSSKP